ncbi:CPBP family intramembrane metalloprotease [Candidatus Saccharibacteria bacterium]|nr:CPBP family intramembrane metalloprotease [Candidatus Saccharibacteria bacterium]
MIKDKSSIAKKTSNKTSRQKSLQKQWWRLALKVLGLLIWVAAAVIVAQLVVGYLMLWTLGRETFLQPVPTALYSALSYIIALVWILFATPRITTKLKITNRRKTGDHYDKTASDVMGRNDLGLSGMPTWTDIGLAPVGFIVATILAAGLVAIFNIFPWFDAEQAQEVGFSIYVTGFDRIIAFVILVLVAPIAEELIFRGWLYGKLRPMLSERMSNAASIAISIFLVSLLFGIIHLQWNVGVNVFAMSVVLCGLREVTGTIYAGILMHMVKNGVAFYLLYVLGIG